MNTSVLDIQGLKKLYHTFDFGPIDFRVDKGMIVGIIGANGSGKSTFFRLLMRVIQEDEGTILFFDKDIRKQETEIRQKVGYAGELMDAYGHITIAELASLVSYWYPSWDEARFKKLVKRYDIDIDKKFGKSSKGTKKKVDFIFSLCHDSSLLLLDEPTAGVDIMSQRKMKEDMLAYMEDGEKSIVLATHVVEEINQLCDYISVFDSGKIVYSFHKDEVYDHWVRMWVSHVTETIKKHPAVMHVDSTLPQIVTNNLQDLEKVLEAEEIIVNHRQRLTMEEVLEYLLNKEKKMSIPE